MLESGEPEQVIRGLRGCEGVRRLLEVCYDRRMGDEGKTSDDFGSWSEVGRGERGRGEEIPEGMTRREWLKSMTAGAGLKVMPKRMRDALEAFTDGIDQVKAEGGEQERGSEFANHAELAWDRVLVRRDRYGNDFDQLRIDEVYKNFETLNKPLPYFPGEVVESLRERLGLGQDEVEGAVEVVLEDFNHLREISSRAMQRVRQDYHQREATQVAPMFAELVRLGSYIEDVVDGRSEAIVSQLEKDRVVSILEKLHKDRLLVETGGFDVERAREDVRVHLGLSVKLGEAGREFWEENPEWSQVWSGVGAMLRQDVVGEFYPILGAGINTLELVADLEDDDRDDTVGLARRGEKVVEVQTGEGMLTTLFHEMKHYPQVNWIELFENNEAEMSDYLENASLLGTFELMGKSLEAVTKLALMGKEVAEREYLASTTVMRMRERALVKESYSQLYQLCLVLGIDYEGAGENMEQLRDWLNQNSAGESQYINNFPAAGRLMLAVMSETTGRDVVREGMLNEDQAEELGECYKLGFQQLVHFLVDPALSVEGGWHLDLDRNNGGNDVSERVARVMGDLDAEYQEWMSGGVIDAEKVKRGEIEPYGAWVLKLADTDLEFHSYRWSSQQILKDLGDQANERDYRAYVEEYKGKVRMFLGEDTDWLWDMYVLKSFAESTIPELLVLNQENFTSERYDEFVGDVLNSNRFGNFLKLGVGEAVLEKYRKRYPEKWQVVVNSGVIDRLWGRKRTYEFPVLE